MKRYLNNFLSFIWIAVFLSLNTQAQTVNTDSLRAVQKARTDSLQRVQKIRTDSLKAIREYRASQHFKDSVANARQARADSMKAARQRQSDSLKAERKRVSDSLIQARREYNDSMRAQLDSARAQQQRELELRREERKRASDSLASIREYRSSQHYKDSVALIRKQHADSMKMARQHISDSLREVQVAKTDSMRAEIQRQNDSLRASLDSMRAARQVQMDSLAAVRKARADSLAIVKAEREETLKLKKEEKEKKKQLKLELEIAKKKEDYTNETMRKKGWTLPRKVIHNTFTRYNYYFNANKKMEEAHANMLRSKIDNYDSLLSLFPFDPDIDSAKLSSDMDSIIQKASVGIQIHDPRAKWQDDLYLLVGEAYYYKADYQNAGSAFKFIVAQAEEEKKNKAKNKNTNRDPNKPVTYSEAEKTGLASLLAHQPVKNEAMLWLARTLVQSRKEGQAQTLLDMLSNDADFPERLKGRLALEQAYLDLSRNDYRSAVKSLAIVNVDKELPRWMRIRSNFLSGQILQNEGNFQQSNEYFRNAIGLHPELEMIFYSYKNIAYNNLNTEGNPGETRDLLRGMIAEDKYRPYFDQLYFALAKADLMDKKSDEAIEHLKKSISYSQNNRKQKGFSFAALGDEYYQLRAYTESKNAYDSAAMFLTKDQDPVFSLALQRATALNEIVAPADIVYVQDSLLHLASLPEREQRVIIRNYIREFEKRRNDSIFLALNAGATNTSGGSFNPKAQTWYFGNPTLVRQGENEFKQKWGDRPLKDNWRRSTGFAQMDDFNDDHQDDIAASDLPNEDSLFAAIPRTPEEIASAEKELEQALFLLGKGYYTHLEDFNNALITFDTLDQRFPSHANKAEVLYLKYLMAMRQNKSDEASRYNDQLQRQFPETEWAALLRGSGTAVHSSPDASMNERISRHYDETYELLKQRRYINVLERVREADSQFSTKGEFENRYYLLKSIAIAGSGNYPSADSMLSAFLTNHPADPLIPWANDVLNYIRGKGAHEPQEDVKEEIPSLSDQPYTAEPASTHYVVLLAAADLRLFALRSGLMDYNMMKEGNENVNLTMTTFNAEQNMLVFKEFPNSRSASKYMNEIKRDRKLFREYPENDYTLLQISANNYPLFIAKKDLPDYQVFYKKNYR